VDRIALVMALALIVVLVGCGEEEVPTAMTTNELKQRRAELGVKSKTQAKKAKVAKKGGAKPKKQGKSMLDDTYAGSGEEYFYDARDKRDPFRSFLLIVKEQEVEENAGPLADYELGQLDVVAIIWDAKSPHAMVKDPRGRTHILAEGSPVGKNRGRVVHIGDNLLLVKETYVDYAGIESTNDVELRIRASQGG
jgi:Tfp pilus assembly protein PilP